MPRPPRILFVEDDPSQAALLGKLLDSQGYEVIRASDGVEAIDKAIAHVPDLVLLDIRIPGLDGYEVALRLRAEASLSQIPIIALSAHGDPKTAKAVGCDDLLQKPIDTRRLLDRLDRTFGDHLVPTVPPPVPPGSRRPEPDLLAAKGGEIVEKLRTKIQELEGSRDRIEALEKARAEFYRNVSHELCTPLTPSMGYASLLLDGKLGKLSAEQLRAVKSIDKSLERMKLLVEDLLDATALQTGLITVRPSTFEALPLLVEVASRHEEASLGKNVEVRLSVFPGRNLRITTDREKLGRIAHHLLGNAVKFTPAGGTVFVSVLKEQDHLTLDVYDGGPGVPASDLGRIFEPFYQVDGSVTRAHGGMGLGLAIVRRLADALGGVAWAESPPGPSVRIPGLPDVTTGFLVRVRLPATRGGEAR